MSPEGNTLVNLTLIVSAILIPLGLWTHLKIEKRDITVGVALGVIVLGMIPVLNIIALIAFVLPIGLMFPFSKLFILAIVCLWSGIITGFYTMGLVGIAENFKGDKIATANASFGTTYCISQTLTPSVGGYIMDAFGNSGFMLILSIIGLLPLFLNFFTKNTATSP